MQFMQLKFIQNECGTVTGVLFSMRPTIHTYHQGEFETLAVSVVPYMRSIVYYCFCLSKRIAIANERIIKSCNGFCMKEVAIE